MPETIAAALEARAAAPTGAPIPYSEEIHHPALAEPELAAGSFTQTPDGALIRNQTSPQIETAQIGSDFITVMRPGETGTELLPIPDEIAPLLAALRAILAGSDTAWLRAADARLDPAETGWQLTVSPKSDAGPAPHLVLRGCGRRLEALEITEPNGARRLIRFETNG